MWQPFFILDSNYDQSYYQLRHQAPPTDSLLDPKEHPYMPNDPWALSH